MQVPISWLKEYVHIDLSVEELAHRLTLAGLEVEEIRYVGLPLPEGRVEGRSGGHIHPETKVTGLSWDPEKIVVGAIHEVQPHPNADRLVLCRLHDGDEEHIVLTGALNLFHLSGKGPLEEPLKVAYAREGARIFDGHKPGQQIMTLKRAKIRGVESYSMACSEKELGISDEHEGIIILDQDAPIGMPLVDYMGDAVLDITITPNMARDANILGVAREVSALTGEELKTPSYDLKADGPPIEGRVRLEIQEPSLNPRFVLGLVESIEVAPSPYWAQLRLRLAGMRPINNIVDATNYAMLELGEPLHAFDFDVLQRRAGGQVPKIITRLPEPEEELTTLDDVSRTLDDFTVLVADTAGPLSIAGVMGGLESEVGGGTTSVLLEGASWNMINIRRTEAAQNLQSEASYRFSRGVHPAIAELGVRRGLILMQAWAGGEIAAGLMDEYPLPPEHPGVVITPKDVRRCLGLSLHASEMADILRRLEFEVSLEGETVRAIPPDHRLDIGQGVTGVADLMEEIARIHGYDRIPETMIEDELPPGFEHPRRLEVERIRDLLVDLGCQEVVTYRLTAPERERRVLPPDARPDDRPYIRLSNPISIDRRVMRHSLMASVFEIVESNARWRERISIFEIGPVYWASEGEPLPEERLKLVIAITGPREPRSWQALEQSPMDFFDLKGLVQALLEALRLAEIQYSRAEHPTFHPGKCAQVAASGVRVGVLGEVHPLVHAEYELRETPLLAAELDIQTILPLLPDENTVTSPAAFPPVLEDLAVVVDEEVTAHQVEQVIYSAGQPLVRDLRLFDVYRGDQVGPGKKSLAYSVVYQVPERTLTDPEVAKVRHQIVEALRSELSAKLRH
jgi:phenylalanyl-tRNA synthetase beta chain